MSGTANSLLNRSAFANAGDALAFSFGFLARNAGGFVRRVAVPGLLGCCILHSLLWIYCTQLTTYLGYPSDGQAGKVLGIAAAGVLIMLLLHAIVVSRIGILILGLESEKGAFFGISAAAWRIYVANLRLVLGLGLYGIAAALIAGLLSRLGLETVPLLIFEAAAWLLLVWLVARSWFFLVPLSLQTRAESVLAASWRSSRGMVPSILLAVFPCLAVSFVILVLGELSLRMIGIFSDVPAKISFLDAIHLYERNLWPFVLLVSVVYLFSNALMTAVRIRMFRDMAPPAAPV